MKINYGIIILIGLIISNTSFAQDTTHERLVDKYYPKAEQVPPVPNTEKVNPVTTTTQQPIPGIGPVKAVPLNVTVTQSTPALSEPIPPVNEISKDIAPVTQTASQVQAPQSAIDNDAGKVKTSTKTGTDNYNPDPASPIYRDTRLGSSSPLYNTYETNNNGAGSVTTNPNKG